MLCDCGEKAVISAPARCEKHFLEGFERRVRDTIKRFGLLKDGQEVVVAASGGKDSLTLLHVLKDHYDVRAVAIDEGIGGYRDRTIDDLKAYCNEYEIDLEIVSFSDIGAERLDSQELDRPCSVCGVLRRKALMKAAGDGVLATGHNLDDEAQTILMNLLRNNEHLNARIGPIVEREGFPARVKPLYLTPEREVRAYCLLKGLPVHFAECPYTARSFRSRVGEALNRLEHEVPGAKRRLVERFLSSSYEDPEAIIVCKACGGPSSVGLCGACRLTIGAAGE